MKKKKIARSAKKAGGQARSTPIGEVYGIGPVTAAELEAIGVTDLGTLQDLGWEEACARYVQYFPERLNLNAFVGVIGAIEGVRWLKVPKERKEEARRLLLELKARLGRR